MHRSVNADELLRLRLTSSYSNFTSSISAQHRAKCLLEAKPLFGAHIKIPEI